MRLVDEIFPLVEGFYVDLHRNPELSYQEHRTARAVAEWLSRAGYEVATGVGGTGVVGVLRNGEGPTVLLRGDMDALPVEEKTGLPYASTAHGVDGEGNDVPIMHACGHDVHTACLVGTADLLAGSRDRWSGTLMVVAQPAEEMIDGATGMLADGLYTRFGRPDIALAQHVGPQPAGMLVHRAGVIMGASTTVRVRVFGTGGHGSQPHATVDPVVIAANIVTRLQTIVAREINPSEMAVVTVGMLRAGTKSNIIPDEAYLEVNTRAHNDAVLDRVHASIERIVRAEAEASGAPREPEVTRVQEAGVTRNEPDQARSLAATHRAYFGDPYVIDLPEPFTGSEDFGEFGLPGDPDPIPCVLWFVGGTPHDVWSEAPGETPFEKLAGVPGNHSPFFAPDREPTLRAGLAALTLGALTYLGRPDAPLDHAGAATAEQRPIAVDEAPGPAPIEEPCNEDDDEDEKEGESTQRADMDVLLGDDEERRESGRYPGADEHPSGDEDGPRESPRHAGGMDELLDPPPPAHGPTRGTETGPSESFGMPEPTGPAYSAPPPSGPPISAPPPPPDSTPYPDPDDPPYRL
ncbi:hippurate hydrolase [Spinactinospora alkalitolerans]|uniref:Hippurate hydrolase n=2 Tax=Spinactinospora alkalitolerans TaxID=687207 RepID=A0A852U3R9_9ACTN|nr:amidohydrolase [Spinactinospora alkalitolerans]NYE49563.1 hippurate hydrolase [Spinactinospora alkalitolerans]